MHHIRRRCGRSAFFFERPAHRLVRDRVGVAQLDHAARQQAQRPAPASLRRRRAGQGDEVRLLLAVEPARVDPRAATIRAERGGQALLHEAPPQALHGGHPDPDRFRDPLVGPARPTHRRVGLEQDLRVLEPAHVRLAATLLHGSAGWRRRPGEVGGSCPRSQTPDPAVPFKAHADRRHHIPRQRHRVTNWSEYDAALRGRGSLTVWFSEAAIQAWRAEPRTTRGGQPWYSPLAILTALTLRAVFRLPFRQTEGRIGPVMGLLGLDLAVPDHTTLCRRAETLEGPRPRGDGEPVHLLVDSTGLKLCGAGEWLIERHGARRRRSRRKMPFGVDADTGRIVAATLTDRDVDDASQVGPLLDQVMARWPRSRATARTTKKVSTPASASVIPMRPSSCRRARRRCPATRPRPRRHSATATSSSSPRRAGWDGRQQQDTTSAPGSRPPWAGSSR